MELILTLPVRMSYMLGMALTTTSVSISLFRMRLIILCSETSEHNMINRILNKLIDTDVVVKAIPSMYDILTGRVRMSSILGTPLISVSQSLMPLWQANVKSFLDYTISLMAIIITLPISLFLMAGVKLTSKGPIFYSHERVG